MATKRSKPRTIRSLHLATELKSILDTRGMSVATLARKARVKRTSINAWIAGEQPTDIAQLHAVSVVLGVSIEILCFGASEANDPSFSYWTEGVFEGRVRLMQKG